MAALAVCAAAAGLRAQARERRDGAPTFAVSAGCGLTEIDGELWGGGKDYKVRFDRDGIELTPALGHAVPHNLPLSFRWQSVGREVPTAPAAAVGSAPTRVTQGLTVRYVRPELEERYEVRPDGVEQSFVLTSLPSGSGDLIVRGLVATELTLDARGAPHHLDFVRRGVGGVRIGEVTGIDANGERARGSLRCAGNCVELRLPAEFVRAAALPLVIDPLIGPILDVAAVSNDDQHPDGVHHYRPSIADAYLAVWERRFSATDADIRGQRLNSVDGSPVGSLLFIRLTPNLSDAPSVAVVSLRDRFVVAWREQTAASPTYVGVASVSAADGSVSGMLMLSGAGDPFGPPDIGGDRRDSGDEAIVTFANVAQASVVTARLGVAPSGTLAVIDSTGISGPGGPVSHATISQDGGAEGRYLVGWTRVGLAGDTTIEGAVITRNLALHGRPVLSRVLGARESLPFVAGDGLHWIVAYDSAAAGADPDVHCVWVTYEPRTDTAYVGPATVVASGNDVQSGAAVAFIRNSALVAYTDEVLGGRRGAFVRSIDLFTCVACEGTFTVDGDNQRHVPSVAVAYTPFDNKALLLWPSSDPSTGNGDIRARLFDADDGLPSRIANSNCGPPVDVYSTCARPGYAAFRLYLEHAEPGRPAALLLGSGFPVFPCGSCINLMDPFRSLTLPVGVTDARGNLAVPLPLPASGGGIGFQFAYLPSTAPGCAALGASFSRWGSFQAF